MTSIALRSIAPPLPREPKQSWLVRWLGPAWPLKALFLGFPLWWALGLASFAFLIAAAIMGVQMVRRGPIRVPTGFGIWALFLLWMFAGVFVLYAHAPGTVDVTGPSPVIGFTLRAMWYLAVTIAMLYPMNLPPRVLPPQQVVRWMSFLFLICIVGGVAGLLFPHFQFTTPLEAIIPGAKADGFIHEKVHAELTTSSDFLGFDQPRPKAPFTYANAWGNNVGLLLPFFVFAWLTSVKKWRRVAVPVVLAVAAFPIAMSLNRGLWLGLGILAVYATAVLARSGRFAALWTLVVCIVVAAVVIVGSPLWATITLRLETPHSNERRQTVAEVVTTTTWNGSPLLGFGTNRQVAGSFAGIAGGETPNCHQCAAPPLGTQGFMWRLVFTTGFVGTALFLLFILVQWFSHFRRRDPYSILGCMCLAVSGLFFFVYDSLESPLFLLFLAIGLMNAQRPVGVEPTEPQASAELVTIGGRT
jgi:hypothetical protein